MQINTSSGRNRRQLFSISFTYIYFVFQANRLTSRSRIKFYDFIKRLVIFLSIIARKLSPHFCVYFFCINVNLFCVSIIHSLHTICGSRHNFQAVVSSFQTKNAINNTIFYEKMQFVSHPQSTNYSSSFVSFARKQNHRRMCYTVCTLFLLSVAGMNAIKMHKN